MRQSFFAACLLVPLIVFASSAMAQAQQGIDPRCTRMGNTQQQCTCALAVGGHITAGGRWQYSNAQAPAFSQCMRSRFNR